ncbi:biotin transporter BioY [Clostridium sp. MCC353]|uniref:biotin transporter BioY n=1 Tax=Clostridium sp. MCC353 TaxID=2592646 RepID=UPI001C020E24|nr:biotin transporter BioY [Clostridium sp. MCC353]MBT9779401.1 biotin transporter BioY [Clostridium sp. MCC353]
MNTTKSAPVSSNKIATKDIVLVGMFAAILTVISQISIPMPSGMPITIQVFGVALVGVVLGWKLGVLATLVYIFIGAIGLPVFSSFRGGLDVLTGITGGYIIAWPILSGLCGIRLNHLSKLNHLILTIILSMIGLAAVEIIGGLQWSFLSGNMSISAVFTYSMVAFIPKDILITIAAVFLGNRIRKPLVLSGYIK